MVFCKEVELHKVTGFGGDEGGSICEAVFTDFDEVSDGARLGSGRNG